MDYNIFKDDKERKAAIIDLQGLMENPGWKRVLTALDINIEHFDEELHTQHFLDLRPVERLQDRLSDLRKLKELPTLLIQDATEKMESEVEEDSDDVYGDSPPAPHSQP